MFLLTSKSNYKIAPIYSKMCYGPLTRACHWGPITALGIIKLVTGMTIYCNGMWWPPADSLGGTLNSVLFMGFSGLTLYNFLSAMYHGPGYLPPQWKPNDLNNLDRLQYCGVCHGYKAPRSHHCRKCGRCVLKMDHHCPWINNCVGWGNHAHFTSFLAFATIGCTHASIILGCSLFRALNRVHYLYYGTGQEPIVHLGLKGVIMCVLALGFTIGVVIAVGLLLFFQIRAIMRNQTAIEDWIMEKANFRRRNNSEIFKFPYNLGTWKNISEVINFTCQPIGDGITWPVVAGCDQYTLTKEQIEQKGEKRQRTKLYQIIRPASGSWLPITQGLAVCCCPPCTDEARIKLDVGDTVQVTRWKKYWLFGEKVQELSQGEESLFRERGWFPRKCASEVANSKEQKEKKLK